MKGKYLITTDNWFYGPDGLQYKSVWGTVTILEDKNTLGIKTNARSSNWYAQVGSEKNHLVIAGCQIHYAVRCDEAPKQGMVEDYTIDKGVIKHYSRPVNILITE